MNKVRINVECIFGDIINYFTFLDFKKDLKLQLLVSVKMYLVCAIFLVYIFLVYFFYISSIFLIYFHISSIFLVFLSMYLVCAIYKMTILVYTFTKHENIYLDFKQKMLQIIFSKDRSF